MRHFLLWLVVSVAFLSTGPSEAQSIDGNELLETCTSTDPVFGGFCIGYILGAIEGESLGAFIVVGQTIPDLDVSDANEMISALLGHCTPSEATNKQLRDITVKHLKENPAERHNSARTQILEALRAAFPCR